eukprot:3574976-Rhodomonas_salina.3
MACNIYAKSIPDGDICTKSVPDMVAVCYKLIPDMVYDVGKIQRTWRSGRIGAYAGQGVAGAWQDTPDIVRYTGHRVGA